MTPAALLIADAGKKIPYVSPTAATATATTATAAAAHRRMMFTNGHKNNRALYCHRSIGALSLHKCQAQCCRSDMVANT